MKTTICITFTTDETHLLEIGTRFRERGKISGDEFLSLLDWKFRRTKDIYQSRILRLARTGSFDDAVSKLASCLRRAPGTKARLDVLTECWGFPLQAARLLLALLYPSISTEYKLLAGVV